ncbi:hypothetical protein HK097_005780, partial [Rhizophlyctis rosea]
ASPAGWFAASGTAVPSAQIEDTQHPSVTSVPFISATKPVVISRQAHVGRASGKDKLMAARVSIDMTSEEREALLHPSLASPFSATSTANEGGRPSMTLARGGAAKVKRFMGVTRRGLFKYEVIAPREVVVDLEEGGEGGDGEGA